VQHARFSLFIRFCAFALHNNTISTAAQKRALTITPEPNHPPDHTPRAVARGVFFIRAYNKHSIVHTV